MNNPELLLPVGTRDMLESAINNGADAVIVPHGTDTMGYTAAAVSFMLGDIPKPVVFVGAQRSSDRPSSDASSNLMAAARFCVNGNRAGVFVHFIKDTFTHRSRRRNHDKQGLPPRGL